MGFSVARNLPDTGTAGDMEIDSLLRPGRRGSSSLVGTSIRDCAITLYCAATRVDLPQPGALTEPIPAANSQSK